MAANPMLGSRGKSIDAAITAAETTDVGSNLFRMSLLPTITARLAVNPAALSFRMS